MKPHRMNHLNWSRSAGTALTALTALALGGTAKAESYDRDGGGGADTNFNTAVNWNTDTVPVAGDNALINGTTTITSDLYSSGSRLNILEVGRFFGSGTLTQTAGAVYTNSFNVGLLGTGVYNLNGTGSINMAFDLLVGHSGGNTGESGNGTFNMNTTGTFTTNYVNVGATSWDNNGVPSNEASGTFNIAAGTIDSTYGFRVGGNASATAGHSGTMNISGGTVNSNGNFAIGDGSAGAKGFLVMTGGVLNVTGSNGTEFWVGNGHVGDYSTIGHGSATISSGTLNVGSWLPVGRDGGQGTFTVSGDAVVNQGTSDANAYFELGNFDAGGTATVHLDGGTLQTNGIYDNGGVTSTTTFNLNGGTLKARKDNFDFLNADTVNVKNGGAVIDSDGHNIRIDNGLVADGTGGLTKNGTGQLTLEGSNTYTGNTVVNAGTLSINSAYLADSANVTIADGATLNLNHGDTDTIGSLIVGVTPVAFPALYRASDANGGSDPGTPLDSLSGTGKLQVTGPAAGYGGWANANVGSAASNVDTDLDGVTNGVEYFMNAPAGFTDNPSVVTAGAVRTVTWTNGGNIPSAAYGSQFVVQTSPNLLNWTPADSADPNLSNTSGSVTYTITGAGSQFVRLVVTPN